MVDLLKNSAGRSPMGENIPQRVAPVPSGQTTKRQKATRPANCFRFSLRFRQLAESIDFQ
jgi:hypothetical protein